MADWKLLDDLQIRILDHFEDRFKEIEGNASEVYETQMRMLRDMSHIEQRLDRLESRVSECERCVGHGPL